MVRMDDFELRRIAHRHLRGDVKGAAKELAAYLKRAQQQRSHGR